MEEDVAAHVRDKVDAIYRSESRRVLATLIRLLGDFDLAEEGLHDAFAAAVEQWGEKGIPANPRTWLISTGRFKAIDRLRKTEKFESADSEILDRILQVSPVTVLKKPLKVEQLNRTVNILGHKTPKLDS